MNLLVLWLSFVSVWTGTGKVIYLVMGARVLFVQYITLHFCVKAVEKEKQKQRAHHLILSVHLSVHQYQH